jgi:hypothetical protein
MSSALHFRGLEPWLIPYAAYLYDVAALNQLRPRVTSVFRSLQKQQTLYERWQRGLSPYPAAPPGKSQHNYGLAFDMVTNTGYPMDPRLGQLWQQMGGIWGSEKDPVHFGTP